MLVDDGGSNTQCILLAHSTILGCYALDRVLTSKTSCGFEKVPGALPRHPYGSCRSRETGVSAAPMEPPNLEVLQVVTMIFADLTST